MTNWIWPVTFENWPLVKAHKVWGVGKEGKGKEVKKGDMIVFYVNGTLHFQGVYRVKDDWHKPTFEWPGKGYHVAEIDLIEIQHGFASLNKLLPSLKFIEKKSNKLKGLYVRGTPRGPANSGKPISDSDYELILNELKKVQEEPNFQKIIHVICFYTFLVFSNICVWLSLGDGSNHKDGHLSIRGISSMLSSSFC